MCAVCDRIVQLRITPLQFHLITSGTFHGPAFKGGMFRGGFGAVLRNLVCTTGAPACGGCEYLSRCPYSVLFETPVMPKTMHVLRKYPNAPHPFVLNVLVNEERVLPHETKFVVEVTLMGGGLRYLPHVITTIEELGRSGSYGGRFRLAEVCSALDGRLIYDGAGQVSGSVPPSYEVGECGAVPERLRMEWTSALRLRTNGRYNQSPSFVDVVHSLVRRIFLLSEVHGEGGDREWMYELYAAADAVRVVESGFRPFSWERRSGRQQRSIAMDGVLGGMTVEGDLRALLPVLLAGEWVNAGSATSMGMGRYRMSWEGRASDGG